MPTLRQMVDGLKAAFDTTVAEHGGFGAKANEVKASQYEVREVRSGYRGAVRAQYVRSVEHWENVNASIPATLVSAGANFPTLSAMADEYQKGYKAGYVDGVNAESARVKKARETNKQKVDVIQNQRDVSLED